MRERLPGLVAILLLLLLVAGTWWAADYTNRAVQQDPPRRVTHEPDSWAQDFVMLRSNPQGKAINRLEGDYMEHFPDDDSYEITQPRAAGQQEGSPVTTGTADMAVMDQDGARVIMRGNARVARPGDSEHVPLEVTSETLTLLTDEDVVLTDAPAVVVRGNSVMKGTGMRYDNKTRQLQVHSSSDVKFSGRDRRASTSSNSDTADSAP